MARCTGLHGLATVTVQWTRVLVRGRCHIKMSLLWKIRPGRDNHGLDLLCLPHKKSPHYRIAHPSRKSLPGRQVTGKNPSRLDGRRVGRISTGKLSTRETFLGGGGDPKMGHRWARKRAPCGLWGGWVTKRRSSCAFKFCTPRWCTKESQEAWSIGWLRFILTGGGQWRTIVDFIPGRSVFRHPLWLGQSPAELALWHPGHGVPRLAAGFSISRTDGSVDRGLDRRADYSWSLMCAGRREDVVDTTQCDVGNCSASARLRRCLGSVTVIIRWTCDSKVVGSTVQFPRSGRSQLVITWTGDCLRTGKLFRYITKH